MRDLPNVFCEKLQENAEMSRIRTSSDVPYPHCLVETARSEEVRFVIKVDTKHKVCVSFQNLDRGALRNLD